MAAWRAALVGFLAPAQDVDPVAPVGQQPANGLGIVALVGAKARRASYSGVLGRKEEFARCGNPSILAPDYNFLIFRTNS